MIEENDTRSTRCRRLGHTVTFRYCRTEASGRLCSNILNCWWEEFAVEAFLKAHAPGDLEEMLARKPQAKVTTILDLIERAQRKDAAE